jgi:hypothetical protein
MKTVISLCDLTGNMTDPWVEAGYNALLVDPQHGTTRIEGRVTKFAGTVEDVMEYAGHLIRSGDVAMVFGWPPCTDMAVSGARWFKDKYAKDNLFQAKAVMVAEQCRTLGRLSGAPWTVENPVSVLASAFGKPTHYFHPWHYTAYEPDDHYTKKTGLWTGGGFIMPRPLRAYSTLWGEPDNRIHFASPGPERANIRSVTPMGFARAVFAANHTPALSAVATLDIAA